MHALLAGMNQSLGCRYDTKVHGTKLQVHHIHSDTPLIDHLVMREFVSGDLTGGSLSTSVTAYTKHVHVMFNQQTVSSLETLGVS